MLAVCRFHGAGQLGPDFHRGEEGFFRHKAQVDEQPVGAHGGVAVPAHINRGSNGLLINLGLMPEEPFFPSVEIWPKLPCPMEAADGKHVLHSSDAHYLEDILEQEFSLKLSERSVAAFLQWLTEKK